jgi:hypothetical protein
MYSYKRWVKSRSNSIGCLAKSTKNADRCLLLLVVEDCITRRAKRCRRRGINGYWNSFIDGQTFSISFLACLLMLKDYAACFRLIFCVAPEPLERKSPSSDHISITDQLRARPLRCSPVIFDSSKLSSCWAQYSSILASVFDGCDGFWSTF